MKSSETINDERNTDFLEPQLLIVLEITTQHINTFSLRVDLYHAPDSSLSK